MGWSDVSGFSSLEEDSRSKQATEQVGRSRSRSRSPPNKEAVMQMRNFSHDRTLQCLGLAIPRKPVAPPKGTEWWAVPLRESVAHMRGSKDFAFPLIVESTCAGTFCEGWIAQAGLAQIIVGVSSFVL